MSKAKISKQLRVAVEKDDFNHIIKRTKMTVGNKRVKLFGKKID